MKRRALLLVLVAMLVLSIVCLTACEEPETDITHIITAPQTTITTSVDGIPLVIEITNVEIILKDTPNSNICGNAQVKIKVSNQVASNIRVGFVSKGNNI
ncbi:MAG: hypothetical protein IKA29_01260, partial [Clostridia bacterium]|nr:hypothetical protein [Clostridia bacterium]